MPRDTLVCHVYGDMNWVTSPQTEHAILLGWVAHPYTGIVLTGRKLQRGCGQCD